MGSAGGGFEVSAWVDDFCGLGFEVVVALGGRPRLLGLVGLGVGVSCTAVVPSVAKVVVIGPVETGRRTVDQYPLVVEDTALLVILFRGDGLSVGSVESAFLFRGILPSSYRGVSESETQQVDRLGGQGGTSGR